MALTLEDYIVYYGSGDADLIFNNGIGATIKGGAGDDSIYNFGSGAVVYGEEGRDGIENSGESSNVTIKGGAGDDSLRNYGDYVLIDGEEDDDSIYNEGSKVTIVAGTGKDSVINFGNEASINAVNDGTYIYNHRETEMVTITSGMGNDSVTNFGNKARINAGLGIDYVYNEGESVRISVGGGDDSVVNNGAKASIYGGEGADCINNAEARTVIDAGKGNDIIHNSDGGIRAKIKSGAGDDTVLNSGAKSVIDAGSGRDDIVNFGEGTNVTIKAGSGDDSIINYGVKSSIDGGTGNDYISNGANNVTIIGGAGNDSINCLAMKVLVDMGAGDDSVFAGTGQVTVHSGSGNDTIRISGDENDCPVIYAEGGKKIISLGYNMKKAKIFGSDGAEEIKFDESYFYTSNIESMTLKGGKGDDTLYGSKARDIFQYTSGDGNDVIENYSAEDAIQLKSGKVDGYSFEGSDLVLKVGDGSITLKNMTNHNINIMDKKGKVTTKYYGTGYSPLAVIQNCVRTLSESPLEGLEAREEAVKACSSYKSADDLLNKLFADCKAAGNAETFLQKYCGIIFANGDTGAITGWEAGNPEAAGISELMPKNGEAVYPAETTFTKRGLTVTVPKKSTLTEKEQQVVQAVYSWWLDDALNLIEKSYGISFEDNPTSIALTFYNDPDSQTLGVTRWGTVGLNLAYADFTASDKSGGGMDAVLAHELTHVAQNTFGQMGNASPAVVEGMADLTAGREDDVRWALEYLADNPAKLLQYIYGSASDNATDICNYSAGFILWRYLAKQAADSYDVTQAHAWDDSVKISGSSANDLLAVRGDKVTLAGGDGMDTLTAYGEGDSLSGGVGNDYLFAGASASKAVLDGGAGEDILKAVGDKSTLYGGAGSDTIYLEGSGGVVRYVNGDGSDVVFGYKYAKDTIQLESVKSYSVTASGNDTILKVGSDIICLKEAKDEALKLSIYGTSGANKLKAVSVGTKLYGLGGKDTLIGGKGKDYLDGGTGNDCLRGGTGADTLVGGTGNDTFLYASGDGKDIIKDYEAGKDVIKLTKGTITGKKAKGKDVILTVGTGSMTLKNAVGKKITLIDAEGKKSTLAPLVNDLPDNTKYTDTKQTKVSLASAYASTSFDAGLYATSIKKIYATKTTKRLTIYGNDNNNVIKAGSKGSKLYGQDGNDSLVGGKGHDCLYGGVGKDTLSGGAGNDTLCGGKNNDTLYGGTGKDVFLYYDGDGDDVILSYTGDQAIKVMSGNVDDMYASQIHSLAGAGCVQDVILTVGTGSMTLKDMGCNSSFSVIDANDKRTSYGVATLEKRNI